MLKARSTIFLLLLGTLTVASFGQYRTVSTEPGAPKIFPISELREGMKGTARSVFRGAQPEEFTVEILGVMPNWIGPKQDMIVGRLSGANAERTFVFAGMSGSPVYIDGRLVGAISYSFPFAKEPICGITPFDQMRSVMEQAPSQRIASKQRRTFTAAELTTDGWKPALTRINDGSVASGFGVDSRLMTIAGQTFRPIATPVTFSGVPQKVLDQFAPQLLEAGIIPVAAGGGSSMITPLKRPDESTLRGGDSVVVALSRGDIQIAAAGTVTLRDGEKIYAFGHPFFSLGSTSLPMSESHVVTVVPNANNSFKLAVADSMVGTMTQDRNTAIYGLLGSAPKMLPVRIRLTTSNGTVAETNFESIVDETLTPLILNAGVASALSATERAVGESTIELTSEIDIKGQAPLRLTRRYGNGQAVAFAASATSAPLAALLRAGFDNLELTGITVNLKALDGSQRASLDKITVDRTQARPGDTLDVSVYARGESGNVVVQHVPVSIPADAAPGQVTLSVSDGAILQQASPISQFTPATTSEFVAIVNRLKRPDHLYATLTRNTAGTVIGTSEMPNLPPSMMATINNDRTAASSKSAISTVLAQVELPASDLLVAGSQTLTIEIVR